MYAERAENIITFIIFSIDSAETELFSILYKIKIIHKFFETNIII